MSWLSDALEHSDESSLVLLEDIVCGESTINFEYTPDGGDHGTLAIYHYESPNLLTFRYRIFVLHKGGEFRLWGAGHACDEAEQMYFGPRPEQETGVLEFRDERQGNDDAQGGRAQHGNARLGDAERVRHFFGKGVVVQHSSSKPYIP